METVSKVLEQINHYVWGITNVVVTRWYWYYSHSAFKKVYSLVNYYTLTN